MNVNCVILDSDASRRLEVAIATLINLALRIQFAVKCFMNRFIVIGAKAFNAIFAKNI